MHQAIAAAYQNIGAVGFKNFDYYFEMSGVVATSTSTKLTWPFGESSLDKYYVDFGSYIHNSKMYIISKCIEINRLFCK